MYSYLHLRKSMYLDILSLLFLDTAGTARSLKPIKTWIFEDSKKRRHYDINHFATLQQKSRYTAYFFSTVYLRMINFT